MNDNSVQASPGTDNTGWLGALSALFGSASSAYAANQKADAQSTAATAAAKAAALQAQAKTGNTNLLLIGGGLLVAGLVAVFVMSRK